MDTGSKRIYACVITYYRNKTGVMVSADLAIVYVVIIFLPLSVLPTSVTDATLCIFNRTFSVAISELFFLFYYILERFYFETILLRPIRPCTILCWIFGADYSQSELNTSQYNKYYYTFISWIYYKSQLLCLQVKYNVSKWCTVFYEWFDITDNQNRLYLLSNWTLIHYHAELKVVIQ